MRPLVLPVLFGRGVPRCTCCLAVLALFAPETFERISKNCTKRRSGSVVRLDTQEESRGQKKVEL